MTDYVKAFSNPRDIYHREAVRLADQVRDPAHASLDGDGVLRWTSNNSVPPVEVVALAHHLGAGVDVAKCTAARDGETAAFLGAYRAARAGGPTDEERLEARAALGPDVDLVNVVTGHRWRT